MDEDKLLQSAQRKRPTISSTSRLDEVAESYLRQRRTEFRKNASLLDVWDELLPTGFYEHCGIAAISKGVLRIEVDPGPYMHEMRILNEELLEHLKDRCPGAGIKKITVCVRKT